VGPDALLAVEPAGARLDGKKCIGAHAREQLVAMR
jgi:hypothetical protein